MSAEATERGSDDLDRAIERAKIFIHATPKCSHEWGGWREFDDGNGGETFCQKCGMGAMSYSMWND